MSSNDENNNQPGGPQRGPNPPRTSAISLIIAIALVAYLVYSMVPSMFGVSGTDSIPTSDVVAAVPGRPRLHAHVSRLFRGAYRHVLDR